MPYNLARSNEALDSHNNNLSADQLSKVVTAKEMTFKLSNLTSGKIADIENRHYADFVTPPGGWVIHIGTGTFSYSEEGKPDILEWNASGEWQQERDGSAGWVHYTIKEDMQGNHDTRNRYTALTVTVSYLGHSRTYNSLWFFGGPKLIPVDLVVGNGALADIAANDVVPNTLLEAKPYASSPGVRSWLQTHQLLAYLGANREALTGFDKCRDTHGAGNVRITLQPGCKNLLKIDLNCRA
jgi:hypothetical protein